MINSSIKKIGLTQRVTRVASYAERRDSLDQRWWPLVDALGFMPIPLPNLTADYAADYAQALDLSAIIITGGNALQPEDQEHAPERDAFEHSLITWALQNDCPIVGICRGLQMINQYFGGSLSQVEKHVATCHLISFCGNWQQFSTREVNSYHAWGILPENLGENLQAQVTVRPHPQTLKHAKTQVEQIQNRHTHNPLFSLETNVASEDSLHQSDIMISDWSSAALKYAFRLEKPVIFIDVPRKINNPDYQVIDIVPFEVAIRKKIGAIVTINQINALDETIKDIMQQPHRKTELASLREQHVFNIRHSARIGANALVDLLS